MHRSYWRRPASALALTLATAAPFADASRAGGTAQQPQSWAVTGVASDDVLNMRDVPHGDSKKLAGIPSNARGLKNLGCLTPDPSFDRWVDMSEEERANAKLPWCRVEYRGKQGWVAARFLRPDQ